jgi:ketosteroid isomerase-like protein
MLSVLAAACAPQTETDAESVSEVVTVDIPTMTAQVGAFVGAWNAGDMEGLTSGIAEDAVLMTPTGAIVGRDAILAELAQAYDYTVMQQSAAVDEALTLGEYAYARGTWNLDATDEASAAPAMSGQWSAVYKASADGSWQTWRWMWNQPPEQVFAAMGMAE